VLWEARIARAPQVFVPTKFLTSWRTIFYEIAVTDRLAAQTEWMISEAERFRERLVTGDTPDVDYRPSTTRILWSKHAISERRAILPMRLLRRYRAVLAAERKLKNRRGLVINQMLERAGDAGEIGFFDPETGQWVKVATRTASPRQQIIIPAADRVERLNPCGWAKAGG
jgi:hypothetical protein